MEGLLVLLLLCSIVSQMYVSSSVQDNANYKKPTRVPAPVYIDLLLNWVSDQISDPNLFPVEECQRAFSLSLVDFISATFFSSSSDAKFPRNFMAQVKQIYKRLFRLYAPIYW